MDKIKIECAVLGMVSTNCYFVSNTETNETIIIDPADDAFAIKNWCLNGKRTPAAILLTHGHFDHMLAADTLRKEFDVRIYAAEAERELLGNSAYNLSASWSSPAVLDADEYLADGQILSLAGFTIKTILTPGHTKGGMCYYFEEEGKLFSGDTLFCGSYGRVDFPTSSMSEMGHSIREKLFVLPEETQVFPGHGESTTIGYEKVYNPLA